MRERTRRNGQHGSAEECRLVADGGDSEDEEESEDEDAADDDQEAEASEGEAESGTPERDEKTGVLYLDLEGLFLDLLGLEVDLDEVELDVRAAPGDDKLLGNLLSAVAGLLDGPSPGEMLSGLGDDLLGFDALEDKSVGEYVRGGAASMLDDVPVEEFVSQFVTELVRQLTESSESEGGGEEASG